MAATLTKPCPRKSDPRPENRVVGSGTFTSSCTWSTWSQTPDTHREIETTTTTTVSGALEWLSKDPIGISGGLNQYVFCGNNPVNYRDSFGLTEDSFLMNSSQTMAGYLDGLLFGILPNQDDPEYRAGQVTGDITSLGFGLARLGYAGAAKGSSLLLRKAPTLGNAMKAVARRNMLKKIFRLNPWSKFRIYPFSKVYANPKYHGDLLKIIQASGRTNPYLNLLGAGMAGSALSDLIGGDDETSADSESPYGAECK